MQVLHARTCTGTERQLVHLVAACHLIFSVGCDNLHLAMDMLPALRPPGAATPRAGAAGGAGGWPLGLAGLGASDSSGSLASLGGGGGGGRPPAPGTRTQ